MTFRTPLAALVIGLATSTTVSAATLSQTIHFPGASAEQLYRLYLSADGQERITGFPARFVGTDDAPVAVPRVGDSLAGFCFAPDQCGLSARILDLAEADGIYGVTMAWWNFGWVSAVDAADYVIEGRGALDSTLVLTFSDTPGGAQIELVQANVPDYKVKIPNPDGSVEIGPLSHIVNTHWNTLYWDGFRRVIEEE